MEFTDDRVMKPGDRAADDDLGPDGNKGAGLDDTVLLQYVETSGAEGYSPSYSETRPGTDPNLTGTDEAFDFFENWLKGIELSDRDKLFREKTSTPRREQVASWGAVGKKEAGLTDRQDNIGVLRDDLVTDQYEPWPQGTIRDSDQGPGGYQWKTNQGGRDKWEVEQPKPGRLIGTGMKATPRERIEGKGRYRSSIKWDPMTGQCDSDEDNVRISQSVAGRGRPRQRTPSLSPHGPDYHNKQRVPSMSPHVPDYSARSRYQGSVSPARPNYGEGMRTVKPKREPALDSPIYQNLPPYSSPQGYAPEVPFLDQVGVPVEPSSFQPRYSPQGHYSIAPRARSWSPRVHFQLPDDRLPRTPMSTSMENNQGSPPYYGDWVSQSPPYAPLRGAQPSGDAPRTMTRESTRRVKEPPKYNGKSDVNDFLSQFEILCTYNRWTYADQGQELACSLEGEARGLLSTLPRGARGDYDRLCRALHNRFAPSGRESRYAVQLWSRVMSTMKMR